MKTQKIEMNLVVVNEDSIARGVARKLKREFPSRMGAKRPRKFWTMPTSGATLAPENPASRTANPVHPVNLYLVQELLQLTFS